MVIAIGEKILDIDGTILGYSSSGGLKIGEHLGFFRTDGMVEIIFDETAQQDLFKKLKADNFDQVYKKVVNQRIRIIIE